jgi:O-antigen/teichoic acid export membrane protein
MSEVKIDTPADLSIKDRLGFLLKDSVLYGGAAAISKAFALITFPLLARHFSVADYGVLDYYLVLASLLVIFFIFGQDSAVARFFYEHEETTARCQLISQSLVFQLVGLALFLPLLWQSSDWLSTMLIGGSDRELLFKIVLLQLPFLLLINFSQNLLKWTFARSSFLTMSLGFTLVQASLLVIAVLVFDVGILGVLFVSLISNAVFGVLGIYYVRQWLATPRDFQYLREMLPFAVPFGVICVAAAFSPLLERTLIITLLGPEELGMYAAAIKIAMIIGLLISAFQTAWGPFSLSLYKKADAGETYNWVLKLFVLGMCGAAIVLTLLAQPLIHFLATDRYAGATVVIFPLAMGIVIQATSWITEIGISISKRSVLNLYAYATAVFATFCGIILMVPIFGFFGVGLGVFIGYACRAFVSSWLAQRAYPLPWQYTPVVAILGLTLVLGLAALVAGKYWGQQAQTVGLILSLLVLFIAGWRILFRQIDRNNLLAELRLRIRNYTL